MEYRKSFITEEIFLRIVQEEISICSENYIPLHCKERKTCGSSSWSLSGENLIQFIYLITIILNVNIITPTIILLLLETLLQLLTPINLSTYKENLQPFATRLFQDVEYHYDYIGKIKFADTAHQASLWCIVFNKCLLVALNIATVLETVRIHVHTQNIRNFTTFSCSFS
jgi:hypothetical protein